MTWDKLEILTDEGEKVTAQAPVIVSASRSTDIPTFYADWFVERWKKGYIKWLNPFNGVPLYVSFKNTKVSGNLKINGSLISYYSDFKGKIFIDSTEIVFSNSKINDIIIENASTNFTKQTVHLKDKTVVKGSIIFKSGKGEVFVSGDSKLKENQIKGGKIYLEFKE